MPKEIKLDIGGPKGNAYYIIGTVNRLEPDPVRVDMIQKEMCSGDYEHLLKTFKKYFPIVTLVSEYQIPCVDPDLYVLTQEEDLFL